MNGSAPQLCRECARCSAPGNENNAHATAHQGVQPHSVLHAVNFEDLQELRDYYDWFKRGFTNRNWEHSSQAIEMCRKWLRNEERGSEEKIQRLGGDEACLDLLLNAVNDEIKKRLYDHTRQPTREPRKRLRSHSEESRKRVARILEQTPQAGAQPQFAGAGGG